MLKMHLWTSWRSLLTTLGQQSPRGFLYCWCIYEELHCEAQLQFFDTHGCFPLCVHFSIGCSDCKKDFWLLARSPLLLNFNLPFSTCALIDSECKTKPTQHCKNHLRKATPHSQFHTAISLMRWRDLQPNWLPPCHPLKPTKQKIPFKTNASHTKATSTPHAETQLSSRTFDL